ncbi:MAG TPA: GNA1162 family protein [Syntrophales bacterium]|nr:GNA1162 family protein [Syntrophales bacterium]
MWKEPYTVNPDYSNKGIRLIAILPVNMKSGDARVGQMLRAMVLNELYFKGYPKVPLQIIDEKLTKIYKGNIDFRRENIPPKAMGDLLGVDAVLYIYLEESYTDFSFIYAPTHISISFELRSAKTGETLWSYRNRTIKRNYSIFREELEMESCEIFEPAMQEVIDKAMHTLPDGPDSAG